MKLIYLYLIIINLIAVVITSYDKHCAQKDKWRVKEKTLFLISAFGGSIGMYVTMRTIRHKTKHMSFMIGIPAIIIMQIIAILMVTRYAG